MSRLMVSKLLKWPLYWLSLPGRKAWLTLFSPLSVCLSARPRGYVSFCWWTANLRHCWHDGSENKKQNYFLEQNDSNHDRPQMTWHPFHICLSHWRPGLGRALLLFIYLCIVIIIYNKCTVTTLWTKHV